MAKNKPRTPNPQTTHLDKFNRALETKEPHTVLYSPLGIKMKVRALGHLHPDQFAEMVAPGEYASEWGLLTHDPNHPLVKEHRVLQKAQQEFTNQGKYDVSGLVEAVRKEGIRRPVIISKTKHDTPRTDESTMDWVRDASGNVVSTKRHLLLDGHHRTYAAMKTGKLIPTWIADEEIITY